MAEVTSYNKAKIDEIEAAGIASANIGNDGHLIITRNDATTIDAGSLSFPAGAVTMFGSSQVPAGWLLCNGQAISRTLYAALFAVIGTTYGAGDYSTTFNLPNLEARFPRMQAASLGTTGGAGTHTHTQAGHTHTINGHTHSLPAHDHSIGGGSDDAVAHIQMQTGGSNNLVMERITVPYYTADMTSDLSACAAGQNYSNNRGAKVTGRTANGSPSVASGGNNANSGGNNDVDAGGALPPYVNINFIIKT